RPTTSSCWPSACSRGSSNRERKEVDRPDASGGPGERRTHPGRPFAPDLGGWMHAQDIAAAQLTAYFEHGGYAHAGNVAALALERNGTSHVWLSPEVITDPEADDALYWPTESGRELVRRWRAERALFGREVSA